VFDGTRFRLVKTTAATRFQSFRDALWFFPLVLIVGEIRNAISGVEVVGIVRVTLPVLVLALVELIRFHGHLPKGRYDVRNGRDASESAATPAVQRMKFKQQAIRLVLDEGKSVAA
jgi:hypothetical protein